MWFWLFEHVIDWNLTWSIIKELPKLKTRFWRKNTYFFPCDISATSVPSRVCRKFCMQTNFFQNLSRKTCKISWNIQAVSKMLKTSMHTCPLKSWNRALKWKKQKVEWLNWWMTFYVLLNPKRRRVISRSWKILGTRGS